MFQSNRDKPRRSARSLPDMSTSRLLPTTNRRSIVLVADDEQVIQDLLTSVIQRLDLVVICVGDGATAIAAVQTPRDKLLCAA